jgi:hypothetical protein
MTIQTNSAAYLKRLFAIRKLRNFKQASSELATVSRDNIIIHLTSPCPADLQFEIKTFKLANGQRLEVYFHVESIHIHLLD